MPTENRRVATYLPKDISDRLEAFKTERDIKGDSQALIVILSEFLGVSQQVAHPVAQDSSKIIERIQAIESGLESLKGNLLSELQSELLRIEKDLNNRLDDRLVHLAEKSLVQQVKEEIKSELRSEFKSELVRGGKSSEAPGQLNLLSHEIKPEVYSSPEVSSELQDDSLESSEWLSLRECWDYLKPRVGYDHFRRLSPEKLHQNYGLEFDLSRKQGYGARWLKLSQKTLDH